MLVVSCCEVAMRHILDRRGNTQVDGATLHRFLGLELECSMRLMNLTRLLYLLRRRWPQQGPSHPRALSGCVTSGRHSPRTLKEIALPS